MPRYTIQNTRSGVALGTYDGTSPADVLDAMARDAGYDDYAEALAVAPVKPGEITVTEVDTDDE